MRTTFYQSTTVQLINWVWRAIRWGWGGINNLWGRRLRSYDFFAQHSIIPHEAPSEQGESEVGLIFHFNWIGLLCTHTCMKSQLFSVRTIADWKINAVISAINYWKCLNHGMFLPLQVQWFEVFGSFMHLCLQNWNGYTVCVTCATYTVSRS